MINVSMCSLIAARLWVEWTSRHRLKSPICSAAPNGYFYVGGLTSGHGSYGYAVAAARLENPSLVKTGLRPEVQIRVGIELVVRLGSLLIIGQTISMMNIPIV